MTNKELEGKERSCSIVVNLVDRKLVISEFELYLCCSIYFRTNTLGKGRNSSIHPHPASSYGFFYKDGFGIKLPMKIDMSLKQSIQYWLLSIV